METRKNKKGKRPLKHLEDRRERDSLRWLIYCFSIPLFRRTPLCHSEKGVTVTQGAAQDLPEDAFKKPRCPSPDAFHPFVPLPFYFRHLFTDASSFQVISRKPSRNYFSNMFLGPRRKALETLPTTLTGLKKKGLPWSGGAVASWVPCCLSFTTVFLPFLFGSA